MKKKATSRPNSGAKIGYETELWKAADALRGSMDAAEYKHVVLGLIFLKYISDAFEEQHTRLEAERSQGADPEDPDEYRAKNIFWVPKEARWSELQDNAVQPGIGRIVDDAMEAVERDNLPLKGVLPKDYARPALDKQRLGQLINLISNIRIGDEESRSRDALGRVYEYFLSQFAGAEGKKGGEFYTPRCVVRLLVEMIEHYKCRVYDPCCGSSGMFVQSEEFIAAHGGRIGDISIYGQESNYTTWRLARMNLAIRGIEGQIAHGDSFHTDRHPDLKADYILANPPFNVSDWRGEALQIPACLWFIARDKQRPPPPLGEARGEGRNRRAQVLFIDARKLGRMADRTHRELTGQDITRIANTYHSWRSQNRHSGEGRNPEAYTDIPGFCKSATLEEIRKHGHVLTPGRYVGAEIVEDNGEPFREKMAKLTTALGEQFAESQRLELEIRKNLKALGFKL